MIKIVLAQLQSTVQLLNKLREVTRSAFQYCYFGSPNTPTYDIVFDAYR